MNIKHINGFRFKQAILAGANHVISAQKQINKVNVFPVPDADTGNNMAATLSAIARGILKYRGLKLSRLSEYVADHAISGARGNSGTILASFFLSLSKSFTKKKRVTMQEFAAAVERASSSAKASLNNPVEGTILSVMSDWSDWIVKHWRTSKNFTELLGNSIGVAKQSLQKTTDQLPALKAANVVDAGALGFVIFLEGIYESIFAKDIAEKTLANKAFLREPDTCAAEHTHEVTNHYQEHTVDPQSMHRGDLDFQYCTECVIFGDDINVEQIKSWLPNWGDSVVVVGDENRLKLHLHTNAPARLFDRLTHYGELVGQKADDMWAQYRHCIGLKKKPKIALITDSSYSLPKEIVVKNGIKVIPLQILADGQVFLDRINLPRKLFYSLMQKPNANVSTSQPTPHDIQLLLSEVQHQYQGAIVVSLSGRFSGTFQALAKAASGLKDFPIKVIDSRSVAHGHGLVLQTAARAIAADKSLEEVASLARATAANARMYFTPKNVKRLIEGGRLSKPMGAVARLLGLVPLITIDEQGNAKKIKTSFGLRQNIRSMVKLVQTAVAKNPGEYDIIVAHADASKHAHKFALRLQQALGLTEEIRVIEASPIIIAHCGLGTVSVAFSKRDACSG